MSICRMASLRRESIPGRFPRFINMDSQIEEATA